MWQGRAQVGGGDIGKLQQHLDATSKIQRNVAWPKEEAQVPTLVSECV